VTYCYRVGVNYKHGDAVEFFAESGQPVQIPERLLLGQAESSRYVVGFVTVAIVSLGQTAFWG